MSFSAATVSAAIASASLAYLAGSIPFGLILTRARGHGDIRAVGSGNIGATNVLRTGDKWLAVATLLCDVAKGLLPVLVARRFGSDLSGIAAIAAVLGHIFPLWLAFKGGKGVATAFGVLIAYAWPVAAAAAVSWIIVAIVFRYSSLAAVIATAMAPLSAWFFVPDLDAILVILIIALLVMWRHSSNIARLLRGEETRIELRKKTS